MNDTRGWESLDAKSKVLQKALGKGVRPERMVWIFGYARTGSTWLARMLHDLGPNEIWNEPLAGALVGDFYERHKGSERNDGFIFSPPLEPVWVKSVRRLVLDGAMARYPWLPRRGRLIVKEPNGSFGARILSAALPESSFVFLIRDPRDVAASSLAAQREGGWSKAIPFAERSARTRLAETDPDGLVTHIAREFVASISAVAAAYDQHRGPKALTRYEDIRREPRAELRRLSEQLGFDCEEETLANAVADRSWERIPNDQKGDSKVFRKGQAGAWREDLSERQAEIVEEEAGSVLREYYAALA